MKHLTASTTPDDQTRATRIILAWLSGDVLAFDLVLCEADEVPAGMMGLVCALVDHTARLGHQAAPDYADQLRASLLPDTEQETES